MILPKKTFLVGGNEERLVNRLVDGGGREVGASGNLLDLFAVGSNLVGASSDVGVGTSKNRTSRSVSPRRSRFDVTRKLVFYLHLDVVGVGLGGNLARDQAVPSLLALVDDLHSVLLVLALAAEGKNVLRLSVGDLL